MQNNSEMHLRRALKAKAITDCVNKLAADIYQSSALFGDPRAVDHVGDAGSGFQELREQIARDAETLKELTRDDPPEYEKACRSKELYLEGLQILTKLEILTHERNIATLRERLRLYAQLRQKLKTVLERGLFLAHKEQLVEQENSDDEANLRAMIRYTTVGMAVFNLALVGLLAVFFTKSISNRLKLLNDNAYRLASDLPLNPKMTGNDEIARLDQTFHRMARTLKEAARKERAIIEQARDMICSLDKDGRFTAVNPASQMLLGYAESDLVGTHFGRVVAEGRQAAEQFLSDLMQKSDVQAIELRLKRASSKDDSEGRDSRDDQLIVHALLSAHWSESEDAAFIVIHDISDRKRAELLRAELAAMITHDLRTPLTTLGTIVELVTGGRFGKLDEKGDRYLKVASMNVKKMGSLINDMLDIDKVDSGEMQVDLSKVLLDEVFDDCLATITPFADDNGVTLDFAAAPYVVMADDKKLHRVLSNLLSNAIKHAPKDSTVKLTAVKEEGEVIVSVIDNGGGIPVNQLEEVFKRFRQLPASSPANSESESETKTESQSQSKADTGAAADGGSFESLPEMQEKALGSSGLGLAVCKSFVELQGGRIWAESRPGEETRFLFTLKLATPTVH